MIELVTIMVIAGVVAAMAAPRFFNNSAFQSRGFYDQVIFSLRYAQKTAIAQHRFVCVAFTASSVTLTVNATAACPGASLASPSGDTTYGIAAPNSNVVLSGYTSFYFDALGKPYNNADIPPASTFVKQTIAVSGYSTSPVYIEAETGYVH